ncbi:MAG: hypothetical protein OHK0053_00850 [Microscillaceae bacterium]
MAWNCINCESANDYQSVHCEVCGYERYFSIREVNALLAEQAEEPSDVKKVQASYKRVNTVNKKLRQDNKELQDKISDLQRFYDRYAHEVDRREQALRQIRAQNRRLGIGMVISGLLVLLFLLARVKVEFIF